MDMGIFKVIKYDREGLEYDEINNVFYQQYFDEFYKLWMDNILPEYAVSSIVVSLTTVANKTVSASLSNQAYASSYASIEWYGEYGFGTFPDGDYVDGILAWAPSGYMSSISTSIDVDSNTMLKVWYTWKFTNG